ncbi:hypothetical protein AB0F15_13745 [Amycolatopsis sp. NPDC026612]|uniref:hypothetical protein n=1 Tax=Amycolatopsis sp. NPDC026612 TaxID=3155466 RepID=UPI0033F521F1
MATRQQVQQMTAAELDYAEIGRRLGIPPGLAHLIGTGLPADGGDAPSPEERRARGLPPSAQDLSNPGHENPTGRTTVHRWIAERVRADAQMRAAGSQV